MKAPVIRKRIKTNMKAIVLVFVPKPIAAVRMESMMKAQKRAPPFRMPTTCASPIGKASSQPI